MEKFILSEKEFDSKWREHERELRGVIAVKGLPCTAKKVIAECLGSWLKCPVMFLDDLLGADDENEDEEVERNRAFTRLMTMAGRHLSSSKYTGTADNVIIKSSSLNSTFELEQLVQLAHKFQDPDHRVLIIIECQIRNEYKWKERFHFFSKRCKEACRCWEDIDKVKDEHAAQSPTWDVDLIQHYLLQGLSYPPAVVKLVVDPVNDLSIIPTEFHQPETVTPTFLYAIKHLLNAAVTYRDVFKRNPYVLEFDILRQCLFEEELYAATTAIRKGYLCPFGGCVFKYLKAQVDESQANCCCWVCEEHVSGGPIYTCYFCILTLHKSCAERVNFKLLNTTSIEFFFSVEYPNIVLYEPYSCKSCLEGEKEVPTNCTACTFQGHLKCCFAPSVINHHCHQHFLLMQHYASLYNCKACGDPIRNFSYTCKNCALYFHLKCVFMPLEARHDHGRHEHVMKLVYSHDATELEDDHWCNVCYGDMDPQLWFYSCLECPYYITHLHCTEYAFTDFKDMKDVKLIEQLQSQWEDTIAISRDVADE